MNKLFAMLRQHPRKMLIMGMLVSAAMLGSGTIRLVSYSLPMSRKNFDVASQGHVYEWQRHQEEESSNNPLFGKRQWHERALDWTVYKSSEYADWTVGSREHALYCKGLQNYLDHSYEAAALDFEKAYAACCDIGGQVRPGKRLFAADLQLLIGNSYANLSKPQNDKAIAAYEQGLSLDPDNMLTTFNLERLQNAAKGGGKGPDGKDNPQPAGGPRGKRI